MNNPHYNKGFLKYLEELLSNKVGIEAFYVGNVAKYLDRYMVSGKADSDLEKCTDYLIQLRLIREYRRGKNEI